MSGPAPGGAPRTRGGAAHAVPVRPPIFTRPFLAAALSNLLFFLSINGYPAGTTDLDGSEASIKAIKLDAKKK